MVSDVPIIVLTARAQRSTEWCCLELGADDYLVKPFGFRELVARIGRWPRRPRTRAGVRRPTTTVGSRVVRDCSRSTATPAGCRVDGPEVELTPKEYDLLAGASPRGPGAVRTRDDIMEQVWDAHWFGPTKTLDVHIAALRRKLGDATLIETIRGVGFRTADPG